MRPQPLALLVAALVLGSAGADAATRRLKVATDGAYPPFSRIEAGQPVGFDVDVARAVCVRLQADCDIVAPGWDELVPQLLARKVDFVVASQPITEEGRRIVEFSAPYYRIPPRFVARSAGALDPRPVTARGKRFAVRAGTAHAAYLADVYRLADIRVVTVASETEALDALAAGRADFAFGDARLFYGLLDRDFAGRGLRFVGEAVDAPRHFGAGAGITFRRDDAELGRQIDRALTDLDRDGSLDRLVGRWFPFAIR